MRIKIIFISVFLLLSVYSYECYSQRYTGGNVGFHFDNKGYYLDAAPILGYKVGIMNFGVSPFFSYRERNDVSRYSYGGRVFTQATIVSGLFAHAEFELSNIEKGGERKWIVGLPLGMGFRQEIAPNTQAYVTVLYDVLLDEDSPVDNPIVRGGIQYNF